MHGIKHRYFVSVALAVARHGGLHEHVVAPVSLVIYAGVKCPHSLRGPGSALEAAMRKLKIRELSSGGRW